MLTDAKTVTATLADNGAALVQLLGDGDTFLKMLTARHDVINRILSDTAQLGVELTGLVQHDGAQLSGLLANLKQITGVLAADRTQLRELHQDPGPVLGQLRQRHRQRAVGGPDAARRAGAGQRDRRVRHRAQAGVRS